METKTYWAVSIFKTKTFWLNFVAIALEIINTLNAGELYEMVGIDPQRRMLLIMVFNIILRRFTERPARVMKPGDTFPVEVKSL